MSGAETTALGAIAGATIFLGLPLGRVQQLSPRIRNFLAALSAGILLFIFWDVTGAAAEMIENALLGAKDGGSWGRFLVFAVMGAGGLALGALSLAWLERAMLRHRPLPPMSGGSVDAPPAAMMGVDPAAVADQARRAALALGMLIAIGIGVHNFSEGLAIGVASKSGEIALAGTLIIGFALHNATEGFGIVGPLQGTRPTWRWLILAGVIGGGPTFLGTMVGYRVSSEPLELAFLAVAAGAILFVIGELWAGAVRRAGRNLVLSGIIGGFLLGFATDLILVYAGA
ncbi:MAG TPA: ZIP family metal transporter [Gaiellales bacterium]|nr:ZIP family metal transporter [Gaiellales bacterium]